LVYNYLKGEGKKYGYLVNGSKSWLIVKSQELAKEAKRIFGDEVKITTEGQLHLRAVIGSEEYKEQYCRDKVQGWKNITP
jgi:trehalose/maltose hydrolase-like predicted phosphorylase